MSFSRPVVGRCDCSRAPLGTSVPDGHMWHVEKRHSFGISGCRSVSWRLPVGYSITTLALALSYGMRNSEKRALHALGLAVGIDFRLTGLWPNRASNQTPVIHQTASYTPLRPCSLLPRPFAIHFGQPLHPTPSRSRRHGFLAVACYDHMILAIAVSTTLNFVGLLNLRWRQHASNATFRWHVGFWRQSSCLRQGED